MIKALIAVDGSAACEEACNLAGTLLAGREVEVTLLHVMARHLLYGRGGPITVEAYDPKEERAISLALLDSSEQRLREVGVVQSIRKELETGDPAETILSMAEQIGVDLLVLGSTGHNPISRFVRGSVSTKVSSHARCAVLLVPVMQSAD